MPAGEAFEIGTEEYTATEKVGIKELGKVGFILVAGGLGERLGFSGIKVCARLFFRICPQDKMNCSLILTQ